MEGGGDRKRKSCSIQLDWNVLLPTGQDDHPPVLVIEKAPAQELKRHEEGTIGGDDEESTVDMFLRQISEKDLIEKITRAKKSLGPGQIWSKLPDGGEKLKANLKKQEAELERRRLLKEGYKLKEVPMPSAEETTCTGATRNLSHSGAPPPMPSSKPTSGLNACNNLKDKRETQTFSKELSTPVSPHHKNDRDVEKRQKMGLSTRQVPFKSPSHLSKDIEDPVESKSNNEHLGSQSSTPLTTEVTSCSSKKGNAFLRRQNVNTRRKNRTFVLVDEEEPDVNTRDDADQKEQSGIETRIYYPSRDDPEAIEICHSDLDCLAPESYLSSTIMNFYIRYLQKPTSPTSRKRCNYHFFSTYFYKKLKRDGLTKTDKETSYVKFRRWWKGVNIFEKAYIFLPIHENLHWSLIIICIPKKEDESGPIILHLDSLGWHFSKSIFSDVKSFLIEEWEFLRQEEAQPELPFVNNVWKKLSRRIDEKIIEVPQQKNEYDCGLFVLYFMERFIEEAPERLSRKDMEMFGRQWFKPEEASNLRTKISDILREEFVKAASEDACKSDN